MAKIVAITGASGFIGSKLAKHFFENGYVVRTLSRSNPKLSFTHEHRDYDLTRSLAVDDLKDVEILIHAAQSTDDVNIEGAKNLLAQGRKASIGKIVFISSMSAGTEALSRYGQAKFEIEGLLDPTVDLIVRPGLVLGEGGLFGRMAQFVDRFPLIPLIGGGMQPIQTVHIGDLVKAIFELVEADRHGLCQIAAFPELTLRDLNLAIAQNMGKKRIFFNLPISIAQVLIQIAKGLHLPIPVSNENLLGLKRLGRLAPAESPQLSFKLRDYKTSLHDLFSNKLFNDDHLVKGKDAGDRFE